jgi:hypothetical protein
MKLIFTFIVWLSDSFKLKASPAKIMLITGVHCFIYKAVFCNAVYHEGIK